MIKNFFTGKCLLNSYVSCLFWLVLKFANLPMWFIKKKRYIFIMLSFTVSWCSAFTNVNLGQRQQTSRPFQWWQRAHCATCAKGSPRFTWNKPVCTWAHLGHWKLALFLGIYDVIKTRRREFSQHWCIEECISL